MDEKITRDLSVYFGSHFPQRVQPLQMIFMPQVWHFSEKYG